MVLCDVEYGCKCPNFNKKAKYDICKDCNFAKNVLKTFVQCTLDTDKKR